MDQDQDQDQEQAVEKMDIDQPPGDQDGAQTTDTSQQAPFSDDAKLLPNTSDNVDISSFVVITSQPTSSNGQDFSKTGHYQEGARGGTHDPPQDNTMHQINTNDHRAHSQPDKEGARGGAHDPPQDNTMHQINTNDHRAHSQPDKGIDASSVERPQPSAPLDMAKCIIKVDWTGPFPDRWKATLEKALQSCLIKLEASVLSLKLMDDPSCAEVQITPSTALEELKKQTPISLKFKDKEGKSKDVTAHICLDEEHSVTVAQKSRPKENRAPSPKVIGSMPETAASEDTNNVEDVSASDRAPNEAGTSKTVEMTPETPVVLTVPFFLSWYLHHTYGKEINQIQQQHGVSMNLEVSVSITPTKSSRSDSVYKATEDFNKLVQECLGSFSEVAVNHNHLDSDIVKQALHHIQSEELKMMFTMSASNGLFFGQKNFIDTIKREVGETRMESQFNDKSSPRNKDYNFSPQSRSTLDIDTKDLPTQLEMDTVHWDLLKLSYKDQLSQLETKYGVSFNEDKLQNNVTIKVQAQSRGNQHVNLESHATRALTQLYQKLASAAVSCELKNHTDATLVASTLEKLQQQHHCVALSRWRLVGLPEHLGPAIVDIEKTLQKSVFDDEKKKSIGYSKDIPHARGIKWHQTPDYGSGAVGGSVRDERVNLRRRSEADTGFNEDSKDSHESKDAHAEEETCAICMDSFTDKKKLKCGHEFCRDCISASEKSLGSICPVCKEVYGILEGNQPHGTMNVSKSRFSLPGYSDCGTIEINYNIPDGVQTEKHPNPGQRYYGTRRRAYLPDNREGNEVLALLQRAFNQKLIFTVGKSTTTGVENAVTWNDIHHKTSTSGGPQSYGYPDPGYLKRVRDELKAKGIE